MTLSEIANLLNCDKGTISGECHGYTEIYESKISKSCNLLEIGIDKGLSLQMWRQWGPDINLTAIDNNKDVIEKQSLYFNVLLCDQSDPKSLMDIVLQFGLNLFDVIIDDGSHHPDDQILSIMSLWPCLKGGGLYYIEDLHTSSWFNKEIKAHKRIQEFSRVYKTKTSFYCNDKLSETIKP